MVLQWYKKDTPIRSLKFDMVSVWVQDHDIPLRFMNRSVVEEMCEVLGTVDKATANSEVEGGNFM